MEKGSYKVYISFSENKMMIDDVEFITKSGMTIYILRIFSDKQSIFEFFTENCKEHGFLISVDYNFIQKYNIKGLEDLMDKYEENMKILRVNYE